MASTCRFCNAPIIWAISAQTGAKIPLFKLTEPSDETTHRYRLIDATTCDPDPFGDYLSHFRNCTGVANLPKKGKS